MNNWKGLRFIGLICLAIAICGVSLSFVFAIDVPPYTLPAAGVDTTEITMIEEYDIDGVGTDVVELQGVLETRRADPLYGSGETNVSWATSTVVAEFTLLDLVGHSDLFGAVHVTLDSSKPSFAAVTDGGCIAVANVIVEMPALNLVMTTSAGMQLQSTVTTVPPIGDDQTVSVNSVQLIDQSGRVRGTLNSARVVWRELVAQTEY